MKKFLGIIFACLCFVIAGCGREDNSKSSSPSSSSNPKTSTSTPTPSTSSNSSTKVESVGDTIAKINALLNDDVPATVTENITLTSKIEEYNLYVFWSSSNEGVISKDGTYIKPIEDTSVTLTATYTYKGLEKELSYTTLAKGYSEEEKVDAAYGNLSKPLIDETHLNVTLITDNIYGVNVEWEVSGSEYVTIDNNVLTVSNDALLEGATFELVAKISLNGKNKSETFTYTIEPSNTLRAEKVASEIEKPNIENNKNIIVPLTGNYDSSITWSANDEDVIIDGENITLPAKAEQWTLLLNATVTIGEVSKNVSFNYQVEADDNEVVNLIAELIENLPLVNNVTIDDRKQVNFVYDKYINLTSEQVTIFNESDEAEYLKQKLSDIRNKFFITPDIKVENNIITWPANSNALGYELKFIDLNKVYTLDTNLFDFAQTGIPMDSMYNISVKALAPDGGEFIESAEGLAKVGRVSDLPILPTPEVFWNGNRSITIMNTQDARAQGAVSLRVYVNGILRREMPIDSASYYSFCMNGIAESASIEENMDFALQYIGDYQTCQSSDFLVENRPVIGAGFSLETRTPEIKDGYLVWTPAPYNKGYEIRIDDYTVYYTKYNTGITDVIEYQLPISELGLEDGTYNIKIRAMADDAGTAAAFGDPVKLTIRNNKTEGPANVSYDNDSFILSWNALDNVLQYNVSILEIDYHTATTNNYVDFTPLSLENGTYTVTIDAILFENGTSSIEGSDEEYVDYKVATIDYTKSTTLEFEVNISQTKLTSPTNITGDYQKITWNEVENAVGYEVFFEETNTTYQTTTNEFIFSDFDLPMNFDYIVKVRSLAAEIADHSFFSEEVSVIYTLENVAAHYHGATAECNVASQGGQNASLAIDDNDYSRWESVHGYDDVVVTIKLAEVKTLYQLYIYWEAANAAEYNVEISVDGETWTKVFEFSTDKPVQMERKDYINLNTPTEVMYIRINCIKRAIDYGYSIFTFEAYILPEN